MRWGPTVVGKTLAAVPLRIPLRLKAELVSPSIDPSIELSTLRNALPHGGPVDSPDHRHVIQVCVASRIGAVLLIGNGCWVLEEESHHLC